MTIPALNQIMPALLHLLAQQEDGTLHCNKIYEQLAALFPQLTHDEIHEKYVSSKSKWANRVQVTRNKCVEKEYIYDEDSGTGHGLWTITPQGRQYLIKTANLEGVANSKAFVAENQQNRTAQIIDRQEQVILTSAEFDSVDEEDAREHTIRAIILRRGQPEFRRKLLKAYDCRCAITGADVVEALEAAHIIPYNGDDTNHISNGLLLRADIHTLFDLGLIAIDTNTMAIVIDSKLRGTSFNGLEGLSIRLPSNKEEAPNIQSLNIHRQKAGL